MKVVVTPTGRRIEPFDDPPGEALIHNKALKVWLSQALSGAGLEVVAQAPDEPHLVVPDALYTTSEALRRFVDGAAGRPAVLVLKESLFGKYTTPVQPHVTRLQAGWRFEQIRLVCPGDDAPAVDVVVDPEEAPVSVPMPSHYTGAEKFELGLPKHPVMTVHHWVHILWANQIAWAVEALAVPKWRWQLRLLWAAARAASVNKWRVLSKLNQVGRNCDIHPTAVVEYSVLGDNVSVGPHARVRFSRLGDGVMMMGGTQAMFSVLGDKCIVGETSTVNFSVLYPEAVANQRVMQLCVLGRQVVTAAGAFSIDLNFERPTRVPLDGELHDTGQHMMGSAFGHGARVGTGIWLASGRAVPRDAFVVLNPDQVVRRIPPELDYLGPVIADGGTLRPISGDS